MPQYRVKTKSFIGNAIRHEGDIVEYDGEPHMNLEPLGKDAVKRDAKADNKDLQRMGDAARGVDLNAEVATPA